MPAEQSHTHLHRPAIILVLGFLVQIAVYSESFRVKPAADDFPVNDMVYNAFKDYVAKDQNWKVFAPQLERNRLFIEQQLRFQLATAAYGTVAAVQVLTKDDPQIAKAIDVVPRARDLAMAASRARLAQP